MLSYSRGICRRLVDRNSMHLLRLHGHTIRVLLGLILGTSQAWALEGSRQDFIIPAPDGERIGITVYRPQNPVSAPLILHGHGFGLSRARNLQDPDLFEAFAHSDAAAEAARRAWQSGYYVISFDQRGFGESSGPVTLMDPEVDGRNISAIIDWAEANLPGLAYRNGDLLLGALGSSYGGGFQLIGAAVDERFDAIVPAATWHDLVDDLFPEGVAKSIWLNLLSPFALLSSGLQLDPDLYELFLGAQTGAVPNTVLTRLEKHGLRSFCEGGRLDGRGTPDVDALLVQGAHDVLFDANIAYRNYQCLRRGGNDARMLIVDGGHVIPVLQEVGTQPLFSMPRRVNCGGQKRDLADYMLTFLDEKLREVVPPQAIPEICIAQGEDRSLVPERYPVGGMQLTVPPVSIRPGLPGHLENFLLNPAVPRFESVILELLRDFPAAIEMLTGLPAEPMDALFALDDVVAILPAGLINELGGSPLFVPLAEVRADGIVAGTPLLTLDWHGDADTVIFAGLGIRSESEGGVRLMNDQLWPLRNTRPGTKELAGVSQRVFKNDTIGLMLFGFHPYFLNGSLANLSAERITVSGRLEIPYHSDVLP